MLKRFINLIKTKKRVHRPWGWYISVSQGKNFQVKLIHVYKNSKLSVQRHTHRNEHWVVVNGEAKVLNGRVEFYLKENETTYIPKGCVHSLENESNEIPLEIIEVQTGTYLGEDDIERLEDRYGRVK